MNCFSSHNNGSSTDSKLLVFATDAVRNQELSSHLLSPIDHSAILTCINPKAIWFQSPGLSATPLKASLALLLNDYPILAGRVVSGGGSKSVRAMRRGMSVRISINNAGEVSRCGWKWYM